MDGPRICHTELSQSEREKQMYINAYMWNLKNVQVNFSAGQEDRHRCREQTRGHRVGEGASDELGGD